jgi:ADP-ribose pyrophosphatase YjhB (NUDIX family)
MIKHTGLGRQSYFLAPPGGGMHFGTDAASNLVREFREETGITIAVGTFLFVYEYVNDPLHAVELFFRVKKTGGNLATGNDPELTEADQIIHSVGFLSYQEIKSYPDGQPHGIFDYASSLKELLHLRGYFRSSPDRT